MSGYAVNSTNTGWVLCDAPTDVPAGYAWSDTEPVLTIAPESDSVGFINAVKTALGWPAAALTASQSLVNMMLIAQAAIQLGNWTDLQDIIEAANSGAIITPTEYAAIKNSVASFHIPITLP